MDEDVGESEIKETIINVRKLKQGEIAADDHEIPSTEKIWDFSPHQHYFDIVERSLKEVDEYYSSCQEAAVGGGGAAGCPGFYRVPDDMRRRGGHENVYDPKHVDFWKIKDLFEKDDNDDDHIGDVQRQRSQLRHYCYHLRSFAEQDGESVESLMRRLYQKREQMPKQWYPDHDDREEPYFINGASNLWVLLMGSCFLRDLFISPSGTTSLRRRTLNVAIFGFPSFGQTCSCWRTRSQTSEINHITRGYVGLSSYFSDFFPLNVNKEDSLELQFFSYGDQYTPCYHQHVLHCVHYRLLPSARNHEAGNYLASLGGLWWRSPNWLGRRKAPSTMKPVPTATRLPPGRDEVQSNLELASMELKFRSRAAAQGDKGKAPDPSGRVSFAKCRQMIEVRGK
ncbi:hypothetical protein H6P81_016940 [Aristolochia fimbriata]|uniref:Uncharacterized protein n=1 Tax=Aristolochia fimbriata TaxID=158543 RepID=A0AAV7DZR8_ARIFI|nr:hypothetical protein H6P81_016940 [Aristolochia fimbriata]